MRPRKSRNRQDLSWYLPRAQIELLDQYVPPMIVNLRPVLSGTGRPDMQNRLGLGLIRLVNRRNPSLAIFSGSTSGVVHRYARIITLAKVGE